ncbi:hypothetical protein JCM16358_16050 [Halanaerocella petrolearia]
MEESRELDPIFNCQKELSSETRKTFGFSLYQGQPYVMSFRDLLNDMLKEGMTIGALKVLFKHCRDENKTHSNYFRVVVNKWLTKGIMTEEEAKKALIDFKMAKSSTTICKQPDSDCLNSNCDFKDKCPVFVVLGHFDEQVNPKVSSATLKDKKMIEDRLNSIFNTDHLIQAINNFVQSGYREEGETRLSFLFNCDSYTKDWVNRVIKKKDNYKENKIEENSSTLGEELSLEEGMEYLESLIKDNSKGGANNGEYK